MNDLHKSNDTAAFKWLHFSDIHVGMSDYGRLWPRASANLSDDIPRILERCGTFDLIIFSGDLVQKGEAEEYDEFDRVIEEILGGVADLQGKRPALLTVPGNHDLVRSSSLTPEYLALKGYWNNHELQRKIWEKDGEVFLGFVNNSFRNYIEWRNKSIERGTHIAPVVEGFIAGDARYDISTNLGEIAIVGLNSAWLQQSEGDYLGALHVDVNQLLRVTEKNPDRLVRSKSASLLVTHHPASWIRKQGVANWANDINPHGRFDAHLFGHMHSPDAVSISHGGGLARRDIQSASLFGLEYFGNEFERIQGYAAHRLSIDGREKRLTVWPRRLMGVSSGKMKIVPDSSQDIDEETASYTIRYETDYKPSEIGLTAIDVGNINRLGMDDSVDLSLIQKDIGEYKAHSSVRRIEQQACIDALKKDGVVWIAAEWGMGREGFISSIRRILNISSNRTYGFDLNGFENRDEYLDGFRARYGSSLQKMCEAISNVGASILILDDVESTSDARGEASFVAAMEDVAETIAQFAQDTLILICSRRAPRSNRFSVSELRALDEADLASYVRNSEIGGEKYAKAEAVSKLYRLTDGVPSRIDTALRDLEITSLEDLASSNPDFALTGTGMVVEMPRPLEISVVSLKEASDRFDRRAYDLLTALSLLPKGERLSRIKRFFGVHPVGAAHARALLEKGLIDTSNLIAVGRDVTDSTDKALMVPRIVREFVREQVSQDEERVLDEKAIELYFGPDWRIGDIGKSPTGKRVGEALCDDYEIQNASTLIFRQVRRALALEENGELNKAVRLALSFIYILYQGDHYRGGASLCEDMIEVLKERDDVEDSVTEIRYYYARNLRMIGKRVEAIQVFESLSGKLQDKNKRQLVEVELCFARQRQGEIDKAREAAKRAIAINPKSHQALSARAVLAECMENPKERIEELYKLLEEAQKKKADIVANNIRLIIASSSEAKGKKAAELRRGIVNNARREGDYYNFARAIVSLARSGERLFDEEIMYLMESYHYLYNERLYSLFDSCHLALWSVFEERGDIENLLGLFRHSSFIWRLSGRAEKEDEYIRRILSKFKRAVLARVSGIGRDGAYLVVRISTTVDFNAALEKLDGDD